MSFHEAFPALGSGDSRICIAVLDGPVDCSHPCFSGADLVTLETLVQPQTSRGPASDHGTHVASIIFGQPGSSVIGVAPSCRGLIVPVFSDATFEAGRNCSQLDLARAIMLAVENGAHIINISGGQLSPSSEPEPVLTHAIQTCTRNDILIVAAAGNDGCDCLHVPAAAPSVLAVGAMDAAARPIPSSNWGGAYQSQGILAPGVNMIGAVPGGGTTRKTGTSFAAAFVSGLAGVLAGLEVKLGRVPSPHGIRRALVNSAAPCAPGADADCRKLLSGRLNISGALEQLMRGEESMTDIELLSPSGAPAAEAVIASQARVSPPVLQSQPAAGERAIRFSGALAQSVQPSAAPAAAEMPRMAESAQIPLSIAAQAIDQVKPSDCGCGGGASCSCGAVAAPAPALVYALGTLGYDFGSEARKDSFAQAMTGDPTSSPPPNPYDVTRMLDYLDKHPEDAPLLIWTLSFDATPIYAVQPSGAFAENGYEILRTILKQQFDEKSKKPRRENESDLLDEDNNIEIVSVPGVIAGSARLLSGQTVPRILPVLRGIYNWTTKALVENVLGKRPGSGEARKTYDEQGDSLSNFLNRIYYDLRNLGLTGAERALNYSATNVVQVVTVLKKAGRLKLELDTISVNKSPVCRPGSDCYDIELSFFDPNNTNAADWIVYFAIDVSDVMPVTIGPLRDWKKRSP